MRCKPMSEAQLKAEAWKPLNVESLEPSVENSFIWIHRFIYILFRMGDRWRLRTSKMTLLTFLMQSRHSLTYHIQEEDMVLVRCLNMGLAGILLILWMKLLLHETHHDEVAEFNVEEDIEDCSIFVRSRKINTEEAGEVVSIALPIEESNPPPLIVKHVGSRIHLYKEWK